MACNDDRGLEVLEACRRVNVPVPDSVAVIGVDNDECIGRLSIPPLSSIDSSPEVVGYEAARLLETLMEGKKPPRQPIYIQPRGVVTRQSTDVLAIDEKEIVSALRFIRENACSNLRVTDVLEHVQAPRSVLEGGFKKVVGRTVHQEIQRVRLERARELLATTNLPIKRIARDTGFQTVQYLTRVFRTLVGQPPARYRRQLQPEPRARLEGDRPRNT
jgi:LacI family transcriptional regulator